jgi:oxygen-independent coproporphyrinogen-3 oxidase
MTTGINILDRVMKTEVVRSGIQRAIVDRAARMLAPENQEFTDEPLDIAPDPENEPLTLYAHFPFCASACKYCIFKKTLEIGLLDRYVAALLDEIEIYSREPGLADRRVSSIHLGGGTPSLVPAAEIARVLGRLEARFGFSDGIQITLEGNPESLTRDRARGYLAAGVDRISVGVQSLDDDLLRAMGRTHGRETAIEAIRALARAGFDNLSVDLMYGFEGQSTEGLLDDVRAVADLGVDHVSAFPLIGKSVRQTGSAERKRRDGRHREMYRALTAELAAARYDRYSSEDFARRPRAQSRYQIDAWRFPKRDVLALGAGSLGSLGGCFYSNIPDLDRYTGAVAAGRLPVARSKRVPRDEEMRRGVLLGAKYIHVDRAAFVGEYGIDLEDALEPLLSRFRRLGVWIVDERGIHVTDDGLQIVSEIWSELILANLADAARKRVSSSAVA